MMLEQRFVSNGLEAIHRKLENVRMSFNYIGDFSDNIKYKVSDVCLLLFNLVALYL